MNRYYAPGASLDWGRYRRLLDRIEGLRVVDLPHDICCQSHAMQLVEEAEKNSVDAILCSCETGYGMLKAAAAGRVQVRYLPGLLLQSVRGL